MLEKFDHMAEPRKNVNVVVGDFHLHHVDTAFHRWLLDQRNEKVVFWSFLVGLIGTCILVIGSGLLDDAIPSNMPRGEVINQVINAFSTCLVLCLHPERCLHSYMLYRWQSSDQIKLREAYCKNGTKRPNERLHLMLLLVLWHLNCVGQYVLCYLNLQYTAADRPGTLVAICLVVSLGAAIGASVYHSHSPLGQDLELPHDDVERLVRI
ncbi:hypothetical protein MPTK1_3g02180 [Marchantia polymorpha subsp. ruderalis]|uniref:Uncharacterized protein n=2 Tax=Marchantia polymorpha TaxID=3197 RepID=A0AAF6AWL6_MARPO|nr:hypothetical protein MARPO_0007s0207 [Marchantia polymorpha]BBN04150.1 hypothetical protein Mp_3g02180 [Marchantia polymorpha subsp. ruderalis]|eukprot:PTQ47837.1 hypothetical protein MARPO_0007s0207 [Marchantia polymorpha]